MAGSITSCKKLVREIDQLLTEIRKIKFYKPYRLKLQGPNQHNDYILDIHTEEEQDQLITTLALDNASYQEALEQMQLNLVAMQAALVDQLEYVRSVNRQIPEHWYLNDLPKDLT